MQKNATPRVNAQYGAPMGRVPSDPAGPFQGKVCGRRVRLNLGGYDAGGAYWGHGQPIFYLYGTLGGDGFYRGRDKADAIAKACDARGVDP